MRWEWDEDKNRANRRKHDIGFETARLVFRDPLAVSRLDPHSAEERWQTIGRIRNSTVVVIHTWPEAKEGMPGRIISAREATRPERKTYEEDGSF